MNNIFKIAAALMFCQQCMCIHRFIAEKMPAKNKMVLLFDVEKCLTIPVIKEGLDTANQDPKFSSLLKPLVLVLKIVKKVAVTLDLDLESGQPNEDSALMLVELKKMLISINY